jgi:hypothetical protein
VSRWAVAAGLLRAPVAQGRARPSRACSRRAAGICCPRPPTSTTGSRLPAAAEYDYVSDPVLLPVK